jgi:hypothetical protein
MNLTRNLAGVSQPRLGLANLNSGPGAPLLYDAFRVRDVSRGLTSSGDYLSRLE